MTAKHAPATALPVGDKKWTVARSAETNPPRFIDVECPTTLCYQDAAYIAHAANAYPRLVEALKDCLKSQDVYGHIGAGTHDDVEALLRELGEG